MNKQEIFDKVVRHLYAQGRPAMTGDNCMYRDERGLSCAVGCLIPDEFYDPAMENKTACMDPVVRVLHAAGILNGDLKHDDEISGLLGDLQYAHDHWDKEEGGMWGWEDEAHRLQGVRSEHNLIWPEGVPHGS